jgi:tricorn protease
VGHYLIAIDGIQVPVGDNVYRHLENKLGRAVSIAYNTEPTRTGVKTFLVKPVASEMAARYRAWVEHKRRTVEEATRGRVGYMHLPNMMEPGCIEFARAYYAQYRKQGLIIDVRYNGGGFTGDMLIDRIERELWSITQPREGKTIRNPERCFYGHRAVIMNEDTGSNGEYFSEAMKRKKLATIFGMRTWGGAVGIEPHQHLVDGGTTTPPQFAPFGLDGKWMIEGIGVVPDVEVQNQPGEVVRGRDEQLEACIAYLVKKIAQSPMTIPETPPFPIKAKP